MDLPVSGSSGDDDQLCAKCVALTGTQQGLVAACSEQGYPHWASKYELRRSSENCKLCSLILGAISPKRYTELRGPLQTHARSKNDQHERSSELPNAEDPLSGTKILGFHIRNPQAKNSPRVLDLFSFTEFGELMLIPTRLVQPKLITIQDDPASQFIQDRPPLYEVGSALALNQAHKWLSTCRTLHSLCGEEKQGPLPTRVLDLGVSTKDSAVHLKRTEGLHGTYVVLSYCWGTRQQPVTKLDNIGRQMQGLNIATLPKTIQDAITVTRMLGIQYLWIDALCIIQDDEEDRMREIESMGSIYKHAMLTIAASASECVDDGFLHQACKIKTAMLPMWVSETVNGAVQLSPRQHYNNWDEPLHKRGWTFQELLLSKRLLIYGKYEVIWRCLTHDCVTHGRSCISYNIRHLQKLPVQLFGPTLNANRSVLKEQRDSWPVIVEEYSSRITTDPMDKINALVGVITELASAWSDVCLMGLWSKTFVRNLAWSCYPERDLPHQRLDKRIPTWSWLSLSCKTHLWPLLYEEDAELSPISRCLQPFNTTKDFSKWPAQIQLRCRAISAKSFVQEMTPRDYFHIMDLGETGSDHSESLRNDLIIALLGFGNDTFKSALCLVLEDSEEIGLQRVGSLRCYRPKYWASVPLIELVIR